MAKSVPIHWWNTRRLVEDLALDQVTENQSLRYAMIAAVMVIAPLYYGYWMGGEHGWLLLIEFAVVCAISLIGLSECFKANGGSGGAHFLKRLYCLGVPVGLKVMLVSLLVAQLFAFAIPRIVSTANFRDPFFVYQLGIMVLMGALTVFFYWRIAHHMRRIATWQRAPA